MKTKLLNIIGAICIVFSLAACSDNEDNEMLLGGDCMIEALSLDNYEGIINLPSRSVIVRLPETYDVSALKVTRLNLSAGAACTVAEGNTLNMDAAKTLRVRNGDTYIDWTLTVQNDEARIKQFVINDIYTGSIDEAAKSITVYLPASVNVTNLTPTVTMSDYATVTPASGVVQDFTNPVTYTVENNTARSTYVVTVITVD